MSTRQETPESTTDSDAVGIRSIALFGSLPPALDVCCGSRMFWFDRADPRAIFIDRRRETHELPDKSSRGGKRTLIVNPDIVADFTALPFADESFALVSFDPPHFERNGAKGWVGLKYGTLSGDWREMLRQGFAECFRVLEPHGVLVFKWNETQVRLAEVLACTDQHPLFGQVSGTKGMTHWLVFMKEGEA